MFSDGTLLRHRHWDHMRSSVLRIIAPAPWAPDSSVGSSVAQALLVWKERVSLLFWGQLIPSMEQEW